MSETKENYLATSTDYAALLERVVIGGDLSKLTSAEKLSYYSAICESLGLNPMTRPFEYLNLGGKLVLYARRDCTDQLRKRDGVSIVPPLVAQVINDTYVVTATARVGERTDIATGAVSIGNLKGDALANAMMKAETKAKRRVTLSICGLGLLDETEIETIPDARPIAITGPDWGKAPAGEAAAMAEEHVGFAKRLAQAMPDEEPDPGLMTLQEGRELFASKANGNPASERQAGAVAGLIEKAIGGDPTVAIAERHALLETMHGGQSTKSLTAGQTTQWADILTDKDARQERKDWSITERGRKQVAAWLMEMRRAQGQQSQPTADPRPADVTQTAAELEGAAV